MTSMRTHHIIVAVIALAVVAALAIFQICGDGVCWPAP